jgi:subtilisin family serine protease
VVQSLPGLHASAVAANRRDAAALWTSLTVPAAGARARALRPDLAKVWLDGVRRPALDESVPQIGGDVAHRKGFTGTGVTVAVIDTGIDDTHPDLAGKVVARKNFISQLEDERDRSGHGTHVASTIAGTGKASGGRFAGVAPDAKLMDAKVCNGSGFCNDSAILAAMQWAAAEQHAKIVSMSLGGPDSPGADPLESAVDSLSARFGTLFVVAAGNNGRARSLNSPATADAALAVGAVTKQDALADFSSQGPRNDGAVKPEITAPGVDITAARSRDARLGTPGQPYLTLSGTSMATPHVAGSAALLAQRHPDWSGPMLKSALMASAKPNPAIGVFAQGAGRVDIGRGIDQAVTSAPVSLNFGFHMFPHNVNTPVTRPVTYHNSGTAPVTLKLAVHAHNADGTATAAGTFTVSPATLTVPAGGDATAQVTADPRVPGPDGLLGGQLTAAGGTQSVQTPFGMEKELESYNLTVNHLNSDGQPTSNFDTTVLNLAGLGFRESIFGASTQTFRLRKGTYSVDTEMASDPRGYIALMQPKLVLDRDRTVNLDARLAKPIQVTVPNPTVKAVLTEVGFALKVHVGAGVEYSRSQSSFFPGIAVFTAQLGGGAAANPDLTSIVHLEFADVPPDQVIRNSPTLYLLSWYLPGRFVTGYQRAVAPGELATLHRNFPASGPIEPWSITFPSNPAVTFGAGTARLHMFRLPFKRTELINNDGGNTSWRMVLQLMDHSTDNVQEVGRYLGVPTKYAPGHTTTEWWNRAAVGPQLPTRAGAGFAPTTRTGDTLALSLGLWNDRDGHHGSTDFSPASVPSHLILSRDGTDIVNSSFSDPPFHVDVPASAGTYRFEVSGSRGAPVELSTSVDAVWTFRSSHVDGTTPKVLPLSTIRFLPSLDLTGTAPAGRPFDLKLDVKRQFGAPAASIAKLTVEVSFDNGTTWVKVPVSSTTHGGTAHLTHPAQAGFVSLRASVTETDGSKAVLTILRAYRTA